MLTFITNSDIKGITKTNGDIRPRKFGDIFMPTLWGMRTGNILNTCQRPLALVESPTCSYLGGNTKSSGVKMNQISIYNFNNNDVRAQNINGELWFCLNDACKILGLKNSSMAISKKDGVSKIYLTDNLGRQQETTFINEPNLYRLIFRSNKPQAQAFADWVYNEVLPSIRKTGSYSVQQSTINPAVIGGMVKRCVSKAFRDELSNMTREDNFYLCVNIFDKLIASIKKKAYEQARIDERKKITDLLQAMQ